MAWFGATRKVPDGQEWKGSDWTEVEGNAGAEGPGKAEQ